VKYGSHVYVYSSPNPMERGLVTDLLSLTVAVPGSSKIIIEVKKKGNRFHKRSKGVFDPAIHIRERKGLLV
jgi:hypothetical protein